jgi:hypothetical protein
VLVYTSTCPHINASRERDAQDRPQVWDSTGHAPSCALPYQYGMGCAFGDSDDPFSPGRNVSETHRGTYSHVRRGFAQQRGSAAVLLRTAAQARRDVAPQAILNIVRDGPSLIISVAKEFAVETGGAYPTL